MVDDLEKNVPNSLGFNNIKLNYQSQDSNSIKNAPDINVVDIQVVTSKIASINTTNADADVLFLFEALTGHKEENLCFTDFLDEPIMSMEKDAFDLVLKDTSGLLRCCRSINWNRGNKENLARIKCIFSRVLPESLLDGRTIIYETDVENDKFKLQQRNKFRAFMVYAINTDKVKIKNVRNLKDNLLIVFLLDPYHLIFPISDKSKGLSANEQMKKIYNQKKEFKKTFAENFNDKLGSLNFINIDSLT